MGSSGVRISSISLSAGKSPCFAQFSHDRSRRSDLTRILMVAQSGKGAIAKSNAMAHARTSLDGRDAQQESQHGAFLATSLGLEGLRIGV